MTTGRKLALGAATFAGLLYWETDGMILLPSGQAIVGWRKPDLRPAGANTTNTWDELREGREAVEAHNAK